ncbi:uncharacterized protein LOC118396835 [Oncorhynchus keta]|uniref:uncharacterized protein LOC118396835 n=1 Tax=Oncorhynchus keta TaxID=8018 RepID=UPI0015F83CD2|nr:uncharacterized protein LOC118396835 [Oncorhynchus keta]
MFCADQNFNITQVVPFFSSKHGELAIYYEQEEGEKSSSRGIVGVCTETHWITRFLEKSQEGVTALRLASVVFYCLTSQISSSCSHKPDRTFSRFWLATNTALTKQNFILKYDTNIPCQVVLFFNSAIVSATLKSLKFYNISERPRPGSDEETDELFLTAGLQDRVVQVYEGLVYMDFSKQLMDEQGYGDYTPMDMSNLPPFWLACLTALAQL